MLPDIQLDDRRFEDLVAEAKRRIPGYTPEWTDLNDSDPGMTLVQLFAWLAEMMLWRLNRVPDKNFIKFLGLVGIDLKPAVPARAELTFTLSAPALDRAIPIPQGTRVTAGSVAFETDDNLYAISSQIADLQSFDGAQYAAAMTTGVPLPFFYPFGERPQKDAALYVGLTQPFPRGRFTLLVHEYSDDLFGDARAVGGDVANTPPPVRVRWEFWSGDVRKWRSLQVTRDTTVALTQTGFVEFDAPDDPAPMVRQDEGLGLHKRPEDPPLFWLRCRILEVLGPGFEIVPRLEDVLLNTVAATNATTVNDELLGASDGRPNQHFTLANRPILPDSLHLDVLATEDGDFEEWAAQEDLSRSGADDPHYTIDLASGVVTFGDGTHGRIPPLLVNRRSTPQGGRDDGAIPNVRARRYRFGGGVAGNVAAKTITSLEAVIPFVDSVTNVRPASDGEDAESLESAKARAPLEIRSRSRAVTAEDFEFLAIQTPGARIRRAKALPLHHPQFEPQRPAGAELETTLVPVPGVVTVLVVPESKNRLPVAREETLTLVNRYLNAHRLATTEIFVAPARYRKVEVDVRVVARPDAALDIVQSALTDRLLAYFHPLTGGEKGTGWEFGQTIFFSETYRQILTSPGVLRLEADALKTYVDNVEQPPCQDIPLRLDELVWSDSHRIEARYP